MFKFDFESVSCSSKISFNMANEIWGPFYKHGLTLIPAWITNHIHYNVWDEITYQFSNFNGATVGSLEMDKKLLLTLYCVNIYPCRD